MRMSTPFCSNFASKSPSVNGTDGVKGILDPFKTNPRNFNTPILTANKSLWDSSCSHLSEPEKFFFIPETG
jgi:hypothetical protein